VIRSRRAGKRTIALVSGLVVAAIACGSAAAVLPVHWLAVQARLAPVAGTREAGRFSGVLLMNSGPPPQREQSGAQPVGSFWRLTWQLRLPALNGSRSATLRLPAERGVPAAAHVLCTQCSTRAKGTIALTGSEAVRVADADAVVVVWTRSARLRGAVHIPAR
jgi:hypothetical protein